MDIGDSDNNGCGDIAITGQSASFIRSKGWRTQAGHIRIVMNICNIGGQIALEDEMKMNNPLVSIYGAYGGYMAGAESYSADFNGDGFVDMLIGATQADEI